MKLNVLLAKAKQAEPSFNKMIKEFEDFFKNRQKAFKGIRREYFAMEGTIDEPTKRGFEEVVTTVYEKFDWLISSSRDYLDNLFAVEATNASSGVKVPLIVDDQHFGFYSALELLRLKSLLEKSDLEDMYKVVPVRSDAERWGESEDPVHKGRSIFQNALLNGVNPTTEKESYILTDPNLGKDPNYRPSPQIGTKTTNVVLGTYTVQNFSGEITQRQRAEILRRRTKLAIAATAALKEANETEIVASEMTSEKLFGYLNYGDISAPRSTPGSINF